MIKYIPDDVRNPIGVKLIDGKTKIKIIFHCVNDIPVMGSGVAKALMDKWPRVKSDYILWGKNGLINEETKVNSIYDTFGLGAIQLVKVEEDIIVVNLVGQHGIYRSEDGPPIRYEAMRSGLKKIKHLALNLAASVHFPYLVGCDLAGGDWSIMEKIIIEELYGLTLYSYDLFKKRGNYE